MPAAGTGTAPAGTARPTAAIFAVSLYYAPAGGSGTYYDMPNIIYVGRGEREGASPHVARYRYDLRADLPPEFPKRVEDFFPYSSAGPYVVKPDDRIVCRRLLPDGSWQVEADGFAQIPTAELSADSEGGRIEAVSVPIRCMDIPLIGAIYRDSNDLSVAPVAAPAAPDESAAVYDVQTDLPIRFNPDGVPNATPKGVDSTLPPAGSGSGGDDAARPYPVFLSPSLTRRPPAATGGPPEPPPPDTSQPGGEGNGGPTTPVDGYRRAWNLDMAVRYLAAVGNPDERYVRNPPFAMFAALLTSVEPNDDGGAIDLRDYTTYKLAPILVPDPGDLAGRSWPEAIDELVRPHGFGFAWVLGTGEGGDPSHTWSIKRVDDPYPVKTPSHGRYGDRLDDGRTTIHAAQIERSYPRSNAVKILAEPRRKEVAVVLCPAFKMTAGDETSANRVRYKKSEKDQISYRRWIAAEAGDVYYLNKTSAPLTAPLDLSTVFAPNEDGSRSYSRRPRPGLPGLFSIDPLGVALVAQLYVSTDYGTPPPPPPPADPGGGGAPPPAAPATIGGSPYPAVYVPGRGKLQLATKGGWRLLKDSLGIELTCDEPWGWEIGQPKPGSPDVAYRGGIVDVVRAMANPDDPATRPDSNGRPFWLILVATIEDDSDLGVYAPRRKASPARYLIARAADARDRYKHHAIDSSSPLLAAAGGKPGKDFVTRDDTPAAKSHAEALRRQDELGDFRGELTIEGYSRAFSLNDRVNGIARRGLGFDGLANAEQGESPVFPYVAGIDWTNDPEQRTTVHLGDGRERHADSFGRGYTQSKKAREAIPAGQILFGGF